MKIAFIADSFLLDESTGVNGTQVQMYNLASAFKNRGLDIHYVSLTKNLSKQTETFAGIEFHWIKNSQALFSWVNEIKAFKNIVDHIQPDVLYQRGRSHLTYVSASWAKKNGKKFIWGSNGEDSCDFWKLIKRVRRSNKPPWRKFPLYLYQACQDLLIHKGIRDATQVVNQTEFQKERLQKNYKKQGIVLPSYFEPLNFDSKPIKEKMVLWLANLSQGKQPELFIKLAQYCQDLGDWKFVLGGGTNDNKYWRNLRNRAENLPNLEMVGQLPFNETYDYYARASLFVNTSLKEADGLPNSFIQAWLNHSPILSLNHDPNDWIEKHGLGLYAHGTLDEFLNQGNTLLQNEEQMEKMSRRCAQFARKTFAADETIDTYLEIFQKE